MYLTLWSAPADKAYYLREICEPSADGCELVLPDARGDCRIVHGKTGSYFVEYLRESFLWGGFPGWSKHQNRPEEEIEFLRRDLLPI